MSSVLAQAAIMLSKREVASIVAATGLIFEQLKKDSPDKPLEKILISQKGGTWGEETVAGVGFPVLRSSNMRGKKVDVSDAAWCSIPATQAEAFYLQSGDILVTKSSGSSDLVGKAAIFFDPNVGNTYLFSNFTLRLRPDKTKVNPEYLAWFLRSPQSLMWRYEKQQNAVGLRNLQTKEYLNQIIPVPDLKTQEQVVTYLNLLELKDEKANSTPLPPPLTEQRRIVARVEALAAHVSEARSLRRGASEEVNAFLLSAYHLVFQAKEGWKVAKVGDFCENPQYGYTESAKSEPVGPKFLRITDIQDGKVDWETAPYCECPNPEKYLLKPNDIVFARTGATTGKSFLIRECPEAVFASYLIRLRVLHTVTPEYLYAFFQSPDYWSQVTDEKKGTGQPNVNGQKLANIRVPIPPLEEQRRLVAYLDGLQVQVSALRAAQAETGKELSALMPSVLDKAFKGELLDDSVTIKVAQKKTSSLCLLGAVAGDIIGSVYEFNAPKSTEFVMFMPDSQITDDSILTIAVAHAIVNGRSYLTSIREYALEYPNSGYGGMFRQWMHAENPQPYNSFGNGSAMRVSSIGWAFDTVEDVLREAEASAAVTHNHPEGIKGAQAVALAIFRARTGASKDDIRREITEQFGYDLSLTLDEIRPTYQFDETCQKTVPPAIIAFLESNNFEDAVRKSISLGGDADTLAAITGSIAEAFYSGVPEEIAAEVWGRVPRELQEIVERFSRKYFRRADSGPF